MFSRWKITRAAIGAVSKLLELQLRGDGDEGDDGAAAPVDRAVSYSTMGVAVRPIAASTLRALCTEDGDELIALVLWDRTKTPTDLDAGETRVFAAGTVATALRLLAARMDLNATRINLGGAATARVAREGDTVRVTIPVGTTLTGTVGGSPATLTTTVPVTCNGTITSGSTKVRAED